MKKQENNQTRDEQTKESKDDIDHIFKQALSYENQNDQNKEIYKCIDLYKLAANLNHVQACYNLGSIYYQGEITKKNDFLAYKYFKKAADLDHEQALFQIGMMNLLGQGIDQDIVYSIQCLQQAADRVNLLYEITLFQINQVDAMNNLGNIYQSGIGTAIDIQKAIKYYQMAAEYGNICAMANLAQIYLNDNKGVDNNNTKLAIKWLKRAADGGFENAQHDMGIMYEEGKLVKRDFKQAQYWYELAASQGNQDAQMALVKIKKLSERKIRCSCEIY